MQTQAKRWVLLAVTYFLFGVLLGIGMGISEDHRLMGVHAHMNLLGWVSLALTGIIYHLFPAAAASGLARAHFWIYNAGLPVMLIGLADKLLGRNQLEPVLGLGSLAVAVGVLLFVINVLKHRS